METGTSIWRGSGRTMAIVMTEIARRWGEDEAKNYHPSVNCFTFQGWNNRGYRVKKGEKAIKSITFVSMSKADPKDPGKVDSWQSPRTVNLFYHLQVEKK